jgi:hypothetical protein
MIKTLNCLRFYVGVVAFVSTSGFSFAQSQASLAVEAGESSYQVFRAVEDGSWNYRGRPVTAVAGGKLFISYVTSEGDVCIQSMDLESGEINRHVFASSGVDMHNNPPFTFDSQGRLFVFYSGDIGAYTNDRHLLRSREPYDISEFDVVHAHLSSQFTSDGIGRQPAMWSDRQGRIIMQNYIRVEGARRELLYISDDDGESFREHALWSFGLGGDYNDRSYTLSHYDPNHNRIHFLALDMNLDAGHARGIYYVCYDVAEDRFLRADGTTAFGWDDTPIVDGHAYLDVVGDADSGIGAPYWSSIQTDADGSPYLTWSDHSTGKGQGMIRGYIQEYWSRVEDGQWVHYPVGERTGWRTGSHINPNNPHEVFIPLTLDDERTQMQKRVFDEATASFVLAEWVTESLSTVIGDRSAPGIWAPTGPLGLDDGQEIVVWNYGVFRSQYGRRGGYRGSIYVAIRPASTGEF